MSAGERAHRLAVREGIATATLSARRRLNQPTHEEVHRMRRHFWMWCYVFGVIGAGAALLLWG